MLALSSEYKVAADVRTGRHNVGTSTVPGRVKVCVATQEASVQSLLFIASAACAGHVKVEDEKLSFLGAVARADGADELGGGGPDAPHHAAGAARAQLHQVTDELARVHVPQLHRAVV